MNNGGISQRCLAEENLDSIDVDISLMDTNFMGTVAMTKAVLA